MPLMVNGIQVDINAKNNASPVLKQVAVDAQALETQTNSLGASSDAAGGEFSSMGLELASLGSYIAIVTAAIGVMVGAFDFSQEGAQFDRLRQSGSEMARQLGSDLDEIIAKVTAASRGTVSEMDIISSANKAMMLGLSADADQLASLMEVAAFRGRAMGMSTTQAFDDIVRGLGRASPMILDNLGIIIDANSTYADYAESIGKSKDELTKAEKTQALLNKTLETGNKMLEEAGGLADDNAASFERLSATWENFINGAKEATASAGADFADFVVLSLNGWSALGDAMERQIKVNRYAMQLRDMNDPNNPDWYKFVDQANQMVDAQDRLNAAYEASQGSADIAVAAATAVIEVDADAVKGAMEVHATYEKLSDKMAGLQGDHDQLLAKKLDLD